MGVLEDPQEFGRRVSAARGYMQEKKVGFAKAMGTTVPTLTNWEAGKVSSIGETARDRRVLAERIVEVSGCPSDWFDIFASDDLDQLKADLDRRLAEATALAEAEWADHEREVEALRQEVAELRAAATAEAEVEGAVADLEHDEESGHTQQTPAEETS